MDSNTKNSNQQLSSEQSDERVEQPVKIISTRNGNMRGSKTILILSLLLIPFVLGLKISLYARDVHIRSYFPDAFMGESRVPDYIWGLTNAMFPVGGGIGALSITFISNKIGKRNATMLCIFSGLIGQGLLYWAWFSKMYLLLVLSRFFDGLSSGSSMNVGLCYFFEILPIKFHKICQPCVQLFINLGIAFSALLSLDVIIGGTWILTSIPVSLAQAVVLVMLAFLPESPLFVYEQTKNRDLTRRILVQLRGDDADKVNDELNAIINDVHRKSGVKTMSVCSFLHERKLSASLVVMSIIQIFQQLSGINAVIYYANDFMVKAEFKYEDYGALLIISLCLLGSIIFTPLITRFSAKLMLLIGYGGMSAFFLIAFVAWCFGASPVFTVICLGGFLFIFQAGPGPKPWTIILETYLPQHYVAAQGFFTFLNWSANTIVAVGYMYISKPLDFYVALIFGAINLFTFVFLWAFMVDPHAKNHDQIIEEYQRKLPLCH